MSYSNGWQGEYSFAIKNNREYYIENQGRILKGKLSEKEFRELFNQIFKIKNANLKSNKNCCDGDSFSLIINIDSDITKIVQQMKVDDRIIQLSKIVKKKFYHVSNKASDSLYNFKTKSDVIDQPKLISIPH
ncbi:hypothetical protein [Flavobacterium sedimenticola]|uniref:HpaII family restriction endonuclease n=1 Tax=Flavobacterium sedimenticola TaxID=3043286 RepID=A0ABT6XQ21_9FLAO|nr:hypothetical protein [Flavobacterium sedimenticola]MDI9256759.1 hypothetical protein [Flavobacterium sedimenticola]